MLNATYGETVGISTNANRFSENVTGYDKNGNITGLQRHGQTAAAEYGLIDDLSFTLSGNQLNRVDDAATASAYNGGFEFKDKVQQADEYAYDANGNLTKDLNRNIVDIQYNCLNLPEKVTFGDGNTIAYTYAADGTKFRTVHTIGDVTTTTDYCGNVVYENGVQKYLLTEEGYVTLDNNEYHYYLKDHQGNNRVVVDATGQVEETNHYYPFGGIFASSSNSVQPYKYNGKELDTKNRLNWYDYGARHYDAALGRFTTVDPMTEKYHGVSPYLYCGNNPINRIDPTGADWYRFGNYEDETIQYVWNENIHSQKELDKVVKGAEYLGKTFIEGNTYYSLFGSQLDANSFEGNIYQKIDQAIISAQKYKQEMRTYTGGEDISKPKTDFSIKGFTAIDSKYLGIDSHRNEYSINYEGSAQGIYRVVGDNNLMKASMRDWIGDGDMPKHIGGWQSGPKMYHIRFLNNKGLDIVHLQFDSRNANALLQKYNKLFPR